MRDYIDVEVVLNGTVPLEEWEEWMSAKGGYSDLCYPYLYGALSMQVRFMIERAKKEKK